MTGSARRSAGQVARRKFDPRQAGLVDGTDDDPRTMVRPPAPMHHVVRPGRELVGWTLSPRYYEIVLWRGPKGHREFRTQRAADLQQARELAWTAIRLDGWDGAWISPSPT